MGYVLFSINPLYIVWGGKQVRGKRATGKLLALSAMALVELMKIIS